MTWKGTAVVRIAGLGWAVATMAPPSPASGVQGWKDACGMCEAGLENHRDVPIEWGTRIGTQGVQQEVSTAFSCLQHTVWMGRLLERFEAKEWGFQPIEAMCVVVHHIVSDPHLPQVLIVINLLRLRQREGKEGSVHLAAKTWHDLGSHHCLSQLQNQSFGG